MVDAPMPAADKPAPKAKALLSAGEVEIFVDRWWHDHFPGSSLGRHTEAWNHVHQAKEDLKARLKKLGT
jgi:hypothetical protein